MNTTPPYATELIACDDAQMETTERKILDGRVIGVTAERRSHQQVRYLEARGATVLHAAALRTRQADDQRELLEATDDIISDPPEMLIVQTGQGLQWWLDCAEAAGKATELVTALTETAVLTRGPKSSSTVRRAGLEVAWQAPEETVADLIGKVSEMDLGDTRVAVQLDGNNAPGLVQAVRSAGAQVVELDVYRYCLPNDLAPTTALIDRVIEGTIDAITFTASPAIRHFREIAEMHDAAEQLDHAFRTSTLAVVVGPVCAHTARMARWELIVEPETARLIPMLEQLTAQLTADPGTATPHRPRPEI